MALCGDFQNKFLEKMVSIDTANPGVFAKLRELKNGEQTSRKTWFGRSYAGRRSNRCV